MIYVWVASFILFGITTVLAFLGFCNQREVVNYKLRTKLIISVIALISFVVLLTTSILVFTPNIGKDEFVTITPVSEVYKNNQPTAYYLYYVVKDGDDTLYEINVDRLSAGDSNYVITKTYSNGNVSNELVLIDKESIPLLPNFNN